MYSEILDSVRENNEDNSIMSEVSLMRAALMGDPVILSPNQAMDSINLQEIIMNNSKSGSSANAFCRAVELGIVCVAIPKQFRDLTAYCIAALNRGLSDSQNEFIISGLQFLYFKDDQGKELHPYEERCRVTECIVERLNEGRRRNNGTSLPEWLSTDEKNMVDQYIESIILLDRAVRTYEDFTSKKNEFPFILERLIVNRLMEEEPETELSKALIFIQKECSKPEAPIYRSYYYRTINGKSDVFSSKTIIEIKTIIDIAYNRTMAMSVKTGSEISIPNNLTKLSDTIIKNDEPELAVQASYKKEIEASGMDWTTVVWIYEETQAIMQDKGLDWQEALLTLYSRESRMPFVMSGKYLCFTSIKVVLSGSIVGGAIINFLQEIINDSIGDMAGEKLPGSPKEVIARSKKAKEVKKMLDTIIFKDKDNKK